MADMIQCPVCGSENPPNSKICQRCQTPLTGETSFQPGQSPVNKDTGELESVLPQWLRDAREASKQSDDSSMDQPTISRRKEDETPKKAEPASTLDFLASLQSQADDADDEEVPDWLASITGTPASKPADTSSTNSRRIETGHMGDFQQSDPEPAAEEEVPSWLAGIQTPQMGGEEKDELTDWLRDSSGGASSFQEQPQSTPSFDSSFAASPSSSDTPDWLKKMQAEAGELEPEPDLSADNPFTSSDWLNQTAAPQTGSGDSFNTPASDTPDWLRQMQSDASASQPAPEPESFSQPSSDTPDWLRQMQGDSGISQPAQEPESFNLPSSDTPDWLRQMQGDAGISQPAQESESLNLPSSNTPDWLGQMSANLGIAQPSPEPESFNLPTETPDWLNQMSADSGIAQPSPETESFNLPTETPDWLSQMSVDSGSASQAKTPEPAGETPDWLSGLGGTAFSDESAPFEEAAPAESEAPASKKVDSTPRWLQDENSAASGTPAWLASNEKTIVPEQSDDVFGGMPDWLKSVAPESTLFDEPTDSQKGESAKAESAPAFSDDVFSGQNDSLFTEMPDWLSNAMDEPAPTSMPEPITGSDALAPDVLPSWVEAMRPSDQGMANIVSAANDQTLEARGALAGLSGVLPAGVGFNPTSKPKAYSIKLNANEEQLKHAGILEQILAAEAAPEVLVTEKRLVSARGLRWGIAFVLVLATFVTVFMRTEIFSMPVGIPGEFGYAVSVAQAIPANAPILVAVDYEPSRAGEMEAAAAPLFDNLILLKQPRLTFIASNEAGATLAERFLAGPLAVHNYQSGVTYLNLGYLSGGHMGIRAFAANPVNTTPVDINNQPAWVSAPLQGVTSLDQFAAIILITDDANAARDWVEQTQDARKAVPILVVSSAQVAPMIQPYYESGQVAGMVSGLYGGALFERHYNNGRPGTARSYWDAYSIGMLLAVLLVVGGGVFSMAVGLRERSEMRKVN